MEFDLPTCVGSDRAATQHLRDIRTFRAETQDLVDSFLDPLVTSVISRHPRARASPGCLINFTLCSERAERVTTLARVDLLSELLILC